MSDIKPLNFERHDIGAHFKKSKSQFIWKLSLDSTLLTIELMCSHFSGKKKVYRDGKLLCEIQKFGTSFQYPFQIGSHMLNIVQHGDIFELRIDNQSFSHMYHMERTKRAFTYDGEQPPSEAAGSDNPYMRERMGLEGQPKLAKAESSDVGYGGYKKGHGVSEFWMSKNEAI
jgi:hypothetical protein